MILTIILVIAQFFLGYAIVSWANIKASNVEIIIYSLVSGIIFGSWILFILYLFMGLNPVSIAISIAIMFIASHREIKQIFCNLSLFGKKKMHVRKLVIENKYIMVFFSVLLLILLYSNHTHNLQPKSDGLYSGRNNWGDLAGHLTVIIPFTENANKNLEYSDYPYVRMYYRFMFEFFTASLISGGASVRDALFFPSIILSVIIFLLLYFLSKEITKNNKIALISLVLFAFAGGFGFIYFLEELNGNSPYPYGIPNYTHYPERNIFFENPLTLLLAQRPFLIALPAALMVFTILWRWYNRKADKKELIFAAALIGFLPLFHWHAFFASAFVSVILFVLDAAPNYRKKSMDKRILRSWALFFLVISILSIPQAAFSISSLTDKIGKGFFELQLGWMAKEQNWLLFWMINLGILFVFVLPAFIYAKKRLRIFYIPFFGLFVLANLVKFQPWDFDNLKILYLWLPLHVVLVSALVYRMLEKSKIIAIVVIFLAALSGVLAIVAESQTSWKLFDNVGIELGSWVKENTEKDSIFLIAPQHNSFVPTLGGRKILMGFEGWIWSRGIFDYGKRVEDIKNIYLGGQESIRLLGKYGVDYIAIGPIERATFNLNETFFDDTFRIVKEYNGYKIYRVQP